MIIEVHYASGRVLIDNIEKIDIISKTRKDLVKEFKESCGEKLWITYKSDSTEDNSLLRVLYLWSEGKGLKTRIVIDDNLCEILSNEGKTIKTINY